MSPFSLHFSHYWGESENAVGSCKEQDLLLRVDGMVLGDGVKKQNYMAPSSQWNLTCDRAILGACSICTSSCLHPYPQFSFKLLYLCLLANTYLDTVLCGRCTCATCNFWCTFRNYEHNNCCVWEFCWGRRNLVIYVLKSFISTCKW